MSIVWFVLELQGAAVVTVLGEFVGVVLAEVLNFGHDLLFFDLLVLLLDVSCSETLPWQTASQEVHEYVAEALQIVSSGLLDSDVSIDRGVSGGSGQTLSLSVLDVDSGAAHELLGKSEVNDVYPVGVFAVSDREVVRLDVSVDDSSRVDVLDSLDGLVGNHENCFKSELALAVGKEVLEGLSKQVHDHNVLAAFDSVVVDLGNGLAEDCGVRMEPEIDLALRVKLLVLGIDLFKLDGDFVSSLLIDSLPNLSESSVSELVCQLIVFRNHEIFHLADYKLEWLQDLFKSL